jgi:hypothetical protein
MTQFQQASTTQRDTGQPRFNWQTTHLIWLLLGLLEALFALHFLLSLIGAGAAGGLIYGLTGIFLLPFAGLAAVNPAASGLVLELSTLVAMAAYGLLGWLLARAVWNIFYRPYANIGISAASIIEQTRPNGR